MSQSDWVDSDIMVWGKETRRDSQVTRSTLETKLRALLLPEATQITRCGDRGQILGYQTNFLFSHQRDLTQKEAGAVCAHVCQQWPQDTKCSVLQSYFSCTRGSEPPQVTTGVPSKASFLILVTLALPASPKPSLQKLKSCLPKPHNLKQLVCS